MRGSCGERFTGTSTGRRLQSARRVLNPSPQPAQMRETVRVTVHDEMPEDRSAAQPFSYLTREEVERFFRGIPQANLRDRTLFDLIYRHGLRRREAAQLTLDDVQGEKIWISRVKRGVSGGYPLHPRSKQLLRA